MRSITTTAQKQTMNSDHDTIEARAQARVRRKLGFYIHAFVYVTVNLGLFALNQVTGDTRWHQFPLMGWGLGLAIHGAVTFMGLQTEGIRRRMVEAEVRALRGDAGR